MLATTWGAGQVAFTILWFALFFIEIWLMISVFIDIFRSDDLPGWAKAAWVVFVLVLPLIGILAYLVIRGDKMRAHQVRMIQEQEEAFRRYILGVVGSSGHSVADELTRLAELRDRGYITDQEFRLLKAQTVGGSYTATV